MPSSENMNVKVIHRLRPIFSIIDDNSVSFIQSFFLCYVFGHYQEMTQERCIIIVCFTDPGNGNPWNNQEVHRSLGIHISEG